MKFYIKSFVIVFSILSVCSISNAGLLSKQRFGIGYNFTFQKLYGSNIESGMNVSYDPCVTYKINNRFSSIFSLGHGFMSGVLTKENESFSTEIMTYDLLGTAELYSKFKFDLFSTFGMGMYHYQPRAYSADSTGNFMGGNLGMSFIFGLGIKRKITSSLTGMFNINFHFTTSNDLDELPTGNNNSYLTMKTGLIYHFKSSSENNEAKSKNSANDSNSQSDDESNLNQMLDSIMEGDEENANNADDMETVISENNELKLKLDEKDALIQQKDQEIEVITNQLALAKQKIIEMENTAHQTSTPNNNTIANSTGASNGNLQIISDKDIQTVEKAAEKQINKNQNKSNDSSGEDIFADNPSQDIDFNTVYNQAMEFSRNKNYESALDLFNKLLEQFPFHKNASDCQYYAGICYFAQNNISEAINYLQKVLKFPHTDKKDDALYMLGRIYMKQGDKNAAKNIFEELIKNYSDSEFAARAKNYRDSL